MPPPQVAAQVKNSGGQIGLAKPGSGSSGKTSASGKKSDLACHTCQKQLTLDATEESVQCCRCKKAYHSMCHEPPLHSDFVKYFPWECPECKNCNVCGLNNDEEKIIICDMCDRAKHIHCLNPPLQQVPTTSWFCTDCVNCASCMKVLPPLKTRSEGFWVDRPAGKTQRAASHRLCKPCLKQKEQGNFCEVCCKASPSDDDYIQCDYCQKWIHTRCGNLDEEQLKLYAQEDQKYMCPICKDQI
ncbi:hypothetical protein FGO68_gene626 [Halteria grandinella]|uniref:PHD-type domain-containing protein n=1 Tax=Halteria grandinella TaxID=5974 RepID=A0A8J8NV95_HALGN|nr:hypothetical protein FGO68_gene626 [Halteria grandinella]